MESRNMVLLNPFEGSNIYTDIENRLMDTVRV